MRFLIQRVNHASVTVDDKEVGKIGKGLLVFVGVFEEDTEEVADKFNISRATKIALARQIFLLQM